MSPMLFSFLNFLQFKYSLALRFPLFTASDFPFLLILLLHLPSYASGIFKPVTSIRIVSDNRSNLYARFHFRTATAGLHLFFSRALSDRTQRIAVHCLYSRNPAAGAVDHFRRDFHSIKLGPFLRYLYPQLIIIINRSQTSFASLTVQPAICNLFIHDQSLPSACTGTQIPHS